MSSISARMKKIQLKMKGPECSQDFSHYKSMGIFPDPQGQLILQSMVGSGQISNSSKPLWLSSLPAKMKKIRSNIIHQFFRYTRADNSGVGGGISSKFEFIQAFMHVLVTCKNEDDARMRMIKSKMKELECSQDFSHYKSMGIFPDAQGQLTPQSLVRSG